LIPAEENLLLVEVGLAGTFVAMCSGNAGLGRRFEEREDAA
jgi:hypothetical protein